WGRVVAQVAYYAYAALSLGAPDRPLVFSVPTGNFGSVFAGRVARKMGLPIEKMIVGCNANDILARFFDSNDMSMRGVQATLSPSMDIEISSNFERLLFELSGRDGARVAKMMADFRTHRRLDVPEDWMTAARRLFDAHALDDDETVAAIARLKASTGRTFDPHSAIAVEAMRAKSTDFGRDVGRIAVATAHPAKFPAAIEAAIGAPARHPILDALQDKPERAIRLRPDLSEVMGHIRSRARILQAAA
ncbi:MAG: threonine synthase, partial [Pseudomonadota bacterium]